MRLVAAVLAAYALLGGLLSFAGWALEIPRFTDWWNTGLTIKTNSALCLIMLATALLLHLLRRLEPIALALAALAGAVGAITLLQHVTGINLGIDTLLFDEAPGSPATVSPNRMGMPAATSFMLMAAGIWLAIRGARSIISAALPLIVLTGAALSLLGFLHRADAMYRAPLGSAVQAATMIAALACALMAAQPQREPVRTLTENSTAGDLARRIIPLAILVPVCIGLARVMGQRAGHLDLAFGTALRTVIEIVLLTGVLWWTIHIVRIRDQQRRDAEEARHRGERRLRRVLDASAVPFMVLAPVRDMQQSIVDFRWAYVNKAAAGVLGRDAMALAGARISELYPDTWAEPGLLEQLTAAAERQEVRDFEVRQIAAGVRGWFQVIVSPLDQDIGVWFSDVSERKRHELELREADQRKDEFLATLAHELRNPLAPIRMAATLAKKPDVPDTQRRWCQDVIDRQVQHMSLLLDDLLDVSRITRGILQVRRTPTLLSALINTALETSRPLIDSKQHALTVHLPRDATVDVDPLRMAQMIANLLNNAAKYTPPGGDIHLDIHVEGQELQISVRDTGIGLASDDVKAIFRMFSQIKSAQDRSEGGLGIGLALTRGLVELHGGSASVHSDGPGRGSTFTLRIPGAVVAAITTAGSKAVQAACHAPLHILIADDNRDAADSLAMLLRCEGHEVMVAGDGHAALEAFRGRRPHAVLLDIGMPRLNGFEVARHIRTIDPAVLLVAITGWGQAGDRERSAAAGFDHHLTKPVDYDALASLLGQPLNR